MFDVTFLIPDYPDWEEYTPTPHDPYEDISDRERERLDMELYELIDAGAFDPEREILI